MVLGISRPTHMARKTGLTFHTAKRWMQEVKDRWSGAVTEEQQNYRRELLYQEAESLARDAWRTVTASNNPSVVVGAFKAILEANERRAELSLPRLVEKQIDAVTKAMLRAFSTPGTVLASCRRVDVEARTVTSLSHLVTPCAARNASAVRRAELWSPAIN